MCLELITTMAVVTPYIIDLDHVSNLITFIILGYLMMRGSV